MCMFIFQNSTEDSNIGKQTDFSFVDFYFIYPNYLSKFNEWLQITELNFIKY